MVHQGEKRRTFQINVHIFQLRFFIFTSFFLFLFFLALRSDSSEGTKCGMFGKVRTKHHRRVEARLEHAAGGHGQRNPFYVHTDCERHAKGCVQPDRLAVLEPAPGQCGIVSQGDHSIAETFAGEQG